MTEMPITLYKVEKFNCVSHLDTFKNGILHLKIYRKIEISNLIIVYKH